MYCILALTGDVCKSPKPVSLYPFTAKSTKCSQGLLWQVVATFDTSAAKGLGKFACFFVVFFLILLKILKVCMCSEVASGGSMLEEGFDSETAVC